MEALEPPVALVTSPGRRLVTLEFFSTRYTCSRYLAKMKEIRMRENIHIVNRVVRKLSIDQRGQSLFWHLGPVVVYSYTYHIL